MTVVEHRSAALGAAALASVFRALPLGERLRQSAVVVAEFFTTANLPFRFDEDTAIVVLERVRSSDAGVIDPTGRVASHTGVDDLAIVEFE